MRFSVSAFLTDSGSLRAAGYWLQQPGFCQLAQLLLHETGQTRLPTGDMLLQIPKVSDQPAEDFDQCHFKSCCSLICLTIAGTVASQPA